MVINTRDHEFAAWWAFDKTPDPATIREIAERERADHAAKIAALAAAMENGW